MGANRITPSEMRRSCTVALDSVNLSKNCYSDVIPFDKNRVTSSSEKISQFIATQGPLLQTYEDFWEMVMQYRCPVVVMLTKLVHNYKVLHCVEFKVIFVISS
ncbi:hypothetical protein ACJW31_05G219400 [Castanea mollissima]